MLSSLLALLGSMAVAIDAALPADADTVEYILPEPREAIVFAPFVLAQQDGLYANAGLDVRFTTIAGGAKVGEALGRGKGDLGGAVGDTPMRLRARGVPVQGVALLGRHAFRTLTTRRSPGRFAPARMAASAAAATRERALPENASARRSDSNAFTDGQ